MKIDAHINSKARSISISKPLAFLDLETTGRTLGLDRVVEIGILKVTPDGKELPFEMLINPEMDITKEATEIHGITSADVQDKPNFGAVAPLVADFLQGCDLAGYNILNFDLPMLDSEFKRVGMPLNIENRHVIDVMGIYVLKEPRDLRAAYRFYCGREHDERAHSAYTDAQVCWQVLQGQLKKYDDLPEMPEQLSAYVNKYKRAKTLDSGGWFIARDGKPVFARGRHHGMSILEVTQSAPEYLEWMRSTGLPNDTIQVINSVLPNFGK